MSAAAVVMVVMVTSCWLGSIDALMMVMVVGMLMVVMVILDWSDTVDVVMIGVMIVIELFPLQVLALNLLDLRLSISFKSFSSDFWFLSFTYRTN